MAPPVGHFWFYWTSWLLASSTCKDTKIGQGQNFYKGHSSNLWHWLHILVTTHTNMRVYHSHTCPAKLKENAVNSKLIGISKVKAKLIKAKVKSGHVLIRIYMLWAMPHMACVAMTLTAGTSCCHSDHGDAIEALLKHCVQMRWRCPGYNVMVWHGRRWRPCTWQCRSVQKGLRSLHPSTTRMTDCQYWVQVANPTSADLQ